MIGIHKTAFIIHKYKYIMKNRLWLRWKYEKKSLSSAADITPPRMKKSILQIVAIQQLLLYG